MIWMGFAFRQTLGAAGAAAGLGLVVGGAGTKTLQWCSACCSTSLFARQTLRTRLVLWLFWHTVARRASAGSVLAVTTGSRCRARVTDKVRCWR